MGLFRQKHFKVTVGLAVVAIAIVVGVVVAGDSKVVAEGKGGYEETSSLVDLRSARGLVADWAQTEDGRDWVLSGEWVLDCDTRCTNAHLGRIEFDMAFAMYGIRQN